MAAQAATGFRAPAPRLTETRSGRLPPPAIGRWMARGGIVSLATVPLLLLAGSNNLQGVSGNLPTAGIDLAASFGRMLIAYVFSLGFALTYGYFAAMSRKGERVLIPG